MTAAIATENNLWLIEKAEEILHKKLTVSVPSRPRSMSIGFAELLFFFVGILKSTSICANANSTTEDFYALTFLEWYLVGFKWCAKRNSFCDMLEWKKGKNALQRLGEPRRLGT